MGLSLLALYSKCHFPPRGTVFWFWVGGLVCGGGGPPDHPPPFSPPWISTSVGGMATSDTADAPLLRTSTNPTEVAQRLHSGCPLPEDYYRAVRVGMGCVRAEECTLAQAHDPQFDPRLTDGGPLLGSDRMLAVVQEVCQGGGTRLRAVVCVRGMPWA